MPAYLRDLIFITHIAGFTAPGVNMGCSRWPS
jgi:hypothetical protein